MNRKKISIIILIAAIILVGYRFVSYQHMEKKQDLYEVEFLSCFGDISCDVNSDNYLTLGLVARTRLSNISKIIEQLNESEELKFDNDAILIKDFKFVDAKTKNKNLKYLTLNIVFDIDSIDINNELEAKQILIGESPYDIGKLFFVPTDFVNSGDLRVKSAAALSLGSGLEDFYVKLNNNGSEMLEIDSINTKRFENHISKILVDRNENSIELKAPNYSFALNKMEKDVEVSVCFNNSNLSEYQVFYFSPSMVYHSINGEEYRLDLNYYASGLMLSEDDLEQMQLRQ